MARVLRESKTDSSGFPYEAYKGTRVWKVVDKAIDELVENGDILETTRREYIVGYICKKLDGVFPKAGA